MNNDKRAWCDGPDHIIVNLSHTEHGMDLNIAEKLFEDLARAIHQARQTPFERWWKSLPLSEHLGEKREARLIAGISFLRDEAERVFNEIRNAK